MVQSQAVTCNSLYQLLLSWDDEKDGILLCFRLVEPTTSSHYFTGSLRTVKWLQGHASTSISVC